MSLSSIEESELAAFRQQGPALGQSLSSIEESELGKTVIIYIHFIRSLSSIEESEQYLVNLSYEKGFNGPYRP